MATLLPVMVWTPHIGVLLRCWIAVNNPHRLGEGFEYNLQFNMLSALATMFGWLIRENPSDRRTHGSGS
jgi:hypothetical protein